MIGVELVMGRGTKTPWDKADLVNPLMREQGVIITMCGPLDNVLKIKPPFVFDESCVDVFCTALDVVVPAVLLALLDNNTAKNLQKNNKKRTSLRCPALLRFAASSLAAALPLPL